MAETMSRQRQASALWAVPIPLVLFFESEQNRGRLPIGGLRGP